jgi:hypothetical protein
VRTAGVANDPGRGHASFAGVSASGSGFSGPTSTYLVGPWLLTYGSRYGEEPAWHLLRAGGDGTGREEVDKLRLHPPEAQSMEAWLRGNGVPEEQIRTLLGAVEEAPPG